MTSFRSRIIAIVPAGGVGQRAGTSYPKQYRPLLGEPMLRWAVRALLAEPRIEEVRVGVAAGDGYAAAALRGLPRTVWRPCGGPTRASTVLAALRDAALASHDWVLVHDAARPGLPVDALTRLIDACLSEGEGGLLAEPVADTVKRGMEVGSFAAAGAAGAADVPGGSTAARAGGHNIAGATNSIQRVDTSVPRDGLWLAQTPQMFPAGALQAALESAGADERVTDEASAMERAGHHPLLVPGSPRNFKVTWPEQFDLMEKWLS